MEEYPFVSAITSEPDNTDLRLAFADWLEDHGQVERAQLIRLVCFETEWRGDAVREARLRELMVEHAAEWFEYCGLPLSWDEVFWMFKSRLAETIAWYERRKSTLLMKVVRPVPFIRRLVGDGSWTLTTAERQATVNAVCIRRAEFVAGPERDAASNLGLAGGRLLLFDPDSTLSDGAAEAASDGFFDADNVPPWDTWVTYLEDRRNRDEAFPSYLVAWVAPEMVEQASRGIAVNPEICIDWASEVDTLLTRRLRAANFFA